MTGRAPLVSDDRRGAEQMERMWLPYDIIQTFPIITAYMQSYCRRNTVFPTKERGFLRTVSPYVSRLNAVLG